MAFYYIYNYIMLYAAASSWLVCILIMFGRRAYVPPNCNLNEEHHYHKVGF